MNLLIASTYDECSNVGEGKIKQIDVCGGPELDG